MFLLLVPKLLFGRPATRNVSLLFLATIAMSTTYTAVNSRRSGHMFSAILGGSLLGMVSSLSVLLFYLAYPQMRTHTNGVLFWRTLCDFGLACTFLYYCAEFLNRGGFGPSNNLGRHWYHTIFKNTDTDEDDPSSLTYDNIKHWTYHREKCSKLAMAYQFLTFGSEMWFFCSSWDLKLTLDDPFTSDTLNMKYYHGVSWTVAVVFAAAMLLPSPTRQLHDDDDDGGAANGGGGYYDFKSTVQDSGYMWGAWYVGGTEVDHYPVCYLSNSRTTVFGGWTTAAHVLLFYLPVSALYVFALFIFWRTFTRFRHRGLSSTLEARLHILAANAVSIIVYALYWTWFGVPYLLTYCVPAKSQAQHALYWVVAFFTPCKGFADLVVFVLTNDFSPAGTGPGLWCAKKEQAQDQGQGERRGKRQGKQNELSGDGALAAQQQQQQPGAGSGGAQANKALRDEVLYFVTSGIKRSALETQAVFLKPRSEGGGVFSALADVDTRSIFIDPLEDGEGLGLRDFYRMLLLMLTGVVDDTNGGEDEEEEVRVGGRRDVESGDGTTGSRGDHRGRDRDHEHDGGSDGGSEGGGSGQRSQSFTHTSYGVASAVAHVSSHKAYSSCKGKALLRKRRAPLFESENEQRLADEVRSSHLASQAPSSPPSPSSSRHHEGAEGARGSSAHGRSSSSSSSSIRVSRVSMRSSGSQSQSQNSTEASGERNAKGGGLLDKKADPPEERRQEARPPSPPSTALNSPLLPSPTRSLNTDDEDVSNTDEHGHHQLAQQQRRSVSQPFPSAPYSFNRLADVVTGPSKAHGGGGGGADADAGGRTADPSAARGGGGKEEAVVFTDFLPGVFGRIREHFRIGPHEYVEEWSAAAKVKLNEGGASNAFFFYSGGERFIAKSCTKAEMETLCAMAREYEMHLVHHPKSLLARLVGAHSLKTYKNEFFFYVMENLFKIDDDDDDDDDEQGNEQGKEDTVGAAADAEGTVKVGDLQSTNADTTANADTSGSMVAADLSARNHDNDNDAPALQENKEGTTVKEGSETETTSRQSASSSLGGGSTLGGCEEGKGERRRDTVVSGARSGTNLPQSVLQERYDIKGSWVNRNAKRPVEGQLVTCQYCNQKYRFKKQPSPNQAGGQQAQQQQRQQLEQQQELQRQRSLQSFQQLSLQNSDAPRAAETPLQRVLLLEEEEQRERGVGCGDGAALLPPVQKGEAPKAASSSALPQSFKGKQQQQQPRQEEFAVLSRCWSDLTDWCPERLNRQHKPSLTYKDNDLNYRLLLDRCDAEETCDILEKDGAFLCSQGIMDYSLLIGVHTERHRVPNKATRSKDHDDVIEKGTRKQSTSRTREGGSTKGSGDNDDVNALANDFNGAEGLNGAESQGQLYGLGSRFGKGEGCASYGQQSGKVVLRRRGYSSSSSGSSGGGGEGGGGGGGGGGGSLLSTLGRREATLIQGPTVYYLGVIDILQKWDLRKKLERFAKVNFYGNDSDGLSCADPDKYLDRFQRKVRDILNISTETDW